MKSHNWFSLIGVTMAKFKSIALIIDDFSDRIVEYENVYLYDYMVNTETTFYDDY